MDITYAYRIINYGNKLFKKQIRKKWLTFHLNQLAFQLSVLILKFNLHFLEAEAKSFVLALK